MSALFASGRAVDIVLAVIVIEALVLIARRRPVVTVALALGPGVLMLVAVRAALVGAGWPIVAGALAASLPVHLLDLRRRGL